MYDSKSLKVERVGMGRVIASPRRVDPPVCIPKTKKPPRHSCARRLLV